ncbi:hypothetical protein BH24ACT19_BH24ACT19_13460 [soil metagenome]
MPRIKTTVPEEATGLRKLMVRMARRQMGGKVPGIMRVLMPDFRVMIPAYWLYGHLNLRKSSPLNRLQREMLATVVNGLVGGAP